MAEIKISELTSGSALSGTEVVPIVQSGATVKVTTQDIADLGGGGGTNPTSTYIPYNDGGAFVDSGFSYTGPLGLEKTLLEHSDGLGSTTLQLNSFNLEYSLGNANATTISASSGIAINGNFGEAIIGCGMSSPTNGVFRASSASNNVWVGTYGESWGVGFHGNSGTMFLGSSLVTPASPSNPTTPVAWYNITNEFGVQFFAPLYQ